MVKIHSLSEALMGEEQTLSVGALLLVLVLLLHLWAGLWLLKPVSPAPQEKPVIIEVSMLAAPLPEAKPLSQQPVIPKENKPVKLEKPQPKLPPRKKTPVLRKTLELPKPQPIPDTLAAMPALPIPVPANAQPASANATTPSPKTDTAPSNAAKKSTGTAENDEDKHIACVDCPEIAYPPIAMRRNWKGSVLLKFQFSADGHVEQLTVLKSSGHDLLDEAALTNAKKWRFTPGKPGRVATKLINFKFND